MILAQILHLCLWLGCFSIMLAITSSITSIQLWNVKYFSQAIVLPGFNFWWMVKYSQQPYESNVSSKRINKMDILSFLNKNRQSNSDQKLLSSLMEANKTCTLRSIRNGFLLWKIGKIASYWLITFFREIYSNQLWNESMKINTRI